jgi:MFS family permease
MVAAEQPPANDQREVLLSDLATRPDGRSMLRLPSDPMSVFSPHFLSREATVAGPGFSRWLVPPAAIAVHMCIGEVYGFSVFNEPLSRLIGGAAHDSARDWTIPQIGWIYSIALVLLGLSAAVFGKWVERSGPRKTMVASALCFCSGLVLSAVGVWLHWLWLIYLGYGVIGGIGLGLGYIAPVSTLMKWFPDRPGMATGMAIMGFGGGALIGAPLGVSLMAHFKSPTEPGVAPTFLTMAALYGAWMLFGAWLVRVPAAGWKPQGWQPTASGSKAEPGKAVSVDQAWKTPQFWLLWVVLCMNVSAGIGILGQASLMCQDLFGVSAAVGGGFAGLLSLFNMGGRFLWSSVSDFTGRKTVYAIYFLLGALLYALVPWTQKIGSRTLFVAVTALIISMYGGGFATIPAYLRDLFGTHQVGAIHGRLITAWSLAALVGPQLINYISTAKKKAGVPAAEAYNSTLYLMCGLLLIGLIANLLVRPVDPRHHLATQP